MNIHILRYKFDKYGTPGQAMVLETAFTCDTLELGWYNNETGRSCVIADSYAAEVWWSPHLLRNVLRLEDKHGRKDCLVHNANFAGDVDEGLITQVHGCTSVGNGYGQVQIAKSPNTQYGIKNSVATLEALLANIGKGPHKVTYEWALGAAPADLSDHQAQ